MDKRNIGNVKKINDNKYVLRISSGFDDYGKRIQLTRTIQAKNDTEAEKALIKFYNEREKLTASKVSKSPKTLGELYAEFKANHISNLRQTTATYYDDLWTLHLKSKESAKLKSFTPKMIYDVLNNCGTGDRTKKGIYGMLFTMFKKAVMWGYMSKNPCDSVEPPKYKAKDKRVYTEDELTNIIEAIDNEPLKLQAIFYFASICGMRRSEIVGLKWCDIDYDNKKINISRAAAKVKNGKTITDETKNRNSIRALTLPETLTVILKKIYIEQATQKLKLAELWHNEDWIFTQWDGSLMAVDTPTHLWIDFLVKYPDLPKTNLHSLRHTTATLMIKHGVPISTVSGILGHAQTSTTLNIYTHAVEDSKVKAINDLEQIIVKKRIV